MTTTTAPTAAASQGFTRRHRGKLILLGLVTLLFAGAAAYTGITLAFTYSSGDRVGFVQKLSKKGWICQTWEGELAMTPVPGVPPQIFAFTVPDEAVAARLDQAAGKRVALQYKQKRGVPTNCFGDTEYFVHDFRVLP